MMNTLIFLVKTGMTDNDLTEKQKTAISDLNLQIGAVRGIQVFIVCLALYEYYTDVRGAGGVIMAGIIAAYMQLYVMPGLPDFLKDRDD